MAYRRGQVIQTQNNILHLHPHSDTVEVLSQLLASAQQGEITGAVIAWRTRKGKHQGTTTGVYALDTIAALGAASKLWSQIDASSDHSE